MHFVSPPTLETVRQRCLTCLWIAGCGLAICSSAASQEIQFERVQLSSEFYSEGATYGDFDNDGHGDVAAGPWIYWGPAFESSSKFYQGEPFSPIAYSRNFLMYSDDVNQDGHLDVLVMGFPGEESWWYENPGTRDSSRPWKQHVMLEYVSNESPLMADIDGDGVKDLVCIYGTGKANEGGRYGYASRPEDPTAMWNFTAISPYEKRYQRFVHGLGVGDVNNDGHADLLEKEGWWENPGQELPKGDYWEFHQVDFSPSGGSQMFAVDLDGDGRNEVLTGLAAHGFGLVYYRALNDEATKFERVTIMSDDSSTSPAGVTVSQLHGVDLADINRDGLPDIVTGKRWWAHANSDPGNSQPATLLWLESQRAAARVRFVPHIVDISSGVGTQIMTGDVNGDDLTDIVSGNKRGVYLFLQRPAELSGNEFLVPGLADRDPFEQRPATETLEQNGALLPAIGQRPLNFGFETGDATDWEIRGPIAAGAISRHDAEQVEEHAELAGRFSVNTHLPGNRIIGEVISRPFRLAASRAKALLGGTDEEQTRVEVVDETSGVVLARATPDGSPGFKLVNFEFPEESVGKLVRIRIIDHDAEGYVQFDAFRMLP